MITCVVIEDNPDDAAYLASFIEATPSLSLKASFINPLEALPYIRQHTPELLFMDIDMPIMNGMDFFRKLHPEPPLCVFVTAHGEYAWEGFETQALDFIVKPVKATRFASCIDRVKEYLELRKRSDIYNSRFENATVIVKEGTTRHQISISEILYVEALKDYTKVVTNSGKILTLSKLKHFIDRLPGGQFVRIHRSYAVALDKVSKIENNDLFIRNVCLPIGKTFRNNLKRLL